jgi:hypothetical protein
MTNPPPIDFNSQPLQVQTSTLLLAVGNCLMAWASVEHSIHELFVSQLVRQSRNKQRFVIARGVWSEVISFEARLRMTTAAINGSLYKLEERRYLVAKGDWKLLSNYTGTMSKLRNEIAHGTMVNIDSKEMKIVPYMTNIPIKEGISIQEVLDRTQLFIELDRTISRYHSDLSLLWQPRIRRLVSKQLPTPDLLLRLRDQAARSRGGQKRKQKKAPRRPSRRK